MEITPDQDYSVAIKFDCDNIANPAEFLNLVSDFKTHIFGGPLDNAFSGLSSGNPIKEVVVVPYRKNEIMFVCPSAAKVIVIFLVDFADQTDRAIAKVFLQEFVEAQRAVRTAPHVTFTKEPPMELAKVSFPTPADSCGFISFGLEERHFSGNKKFNAISLLVCFRSYLHYHIKCSKTYLHMRMRKRVAGWMQVLNRAIPEQDTEKKTITGKTFVRK